MRSFFRRLQAFFQNLGLVEQAQIVASTAVVVIMITIITASIILNKIITWFDFISIITVGVIGFASVYFSLKYGRQLEEQKRELVALNTVAEAINHSIDLNYLLSNVLNKVAEVTRSTFGWLYIVEGKKMALRNSVGTETPFFNEKLLSNIDLIPWLQHVQAGKNETTPFPSFTHPSLHENVVASWISLPLRAADQFAGVLILASPLPDFFPEKQLDLISAFSNYISVALNNAHLFDRLRQSEQQYADLFEHSPDMYHLVNREGVIISCNQTEVQTLGYSKAELIGQPLSQLYPKEFRANLMHTLRNAFEARQEIRDVEEQMMKKDGTAIEVSVNTSLVYDASNAPVLMRCVVRDITEAKKFEQKIMQAQKIDSIGNLAGGVAHDFNNILTSILGSASIMLRRMDLRDKWRPFVEIIETAAKRGSSLTRQLLTFARRSAIEIHPVDLHEILEETIQLFERSVNPNITVLRKFNAEHSIISGDEGQIQQAFLNILINARDAMPDGGAVTIETADQKDTLVRSAPEETEHESAYGTRSRNYISLRFSDTGTGMTYDTQQRMFEPFFTTKEQGKGTGLGLSVVYGVVKSHDGYISVHSAMSRGTAFTVFLPQLPAAEIFRGKRNSAAGTRIVGGTEAILVVDDEETVRETISAMLSDLGYRVSSAASGKEALSALAKRSRKTGFDLVLLDMTMPDMSGKEVFEKISRMKKQVRVLVSSGYTDEVLGNDSFADHVAGFIQKPYEIADIAKKVRSVLDLRPEKSRSAARL
ncbi:MAG: PAS domain S-box protein [Bacteroidota bacterium]|nr:PAS domain S-box protein [Bacteroidota bacterium]